MPDDTVRDGEGGGKWTPGPWVYEHRQDSFDGMFYTQVFTPDNGEAVATVHWYPEQKPYGVTGTHREANARLIAAAPDMAEALAGVEQTAREYVRNWPNSPTVRAPWEAVLAALAKARGEQG